MQARTNKLSKNQLKKKVNDGPITLDADLQSKITTLSSADDPVLASFAAAVAAAAGSPSAGDLIAAVKRLAGTAAENACQHHATAAEGTETDSGAAAAMVELLCDLFLTLGSRPSHRALLSGLKALPPPMLTHMHAHLTSQLLAAAESEWQTASNALLSPLGQSAVQATESLTFFPEHRPAIAPCAAALARRAAAQLQAALALNSGAAALNYATGDAINELVSVLYSLFALFAGEIAAEGPAEAVEPAAASFLNILQTGSLPKELLCSAAVALCAAASLPGVSASQVIATMASGLLVEPEQRLEVSIESKEISFTSSWVDAAAARDTNGGSLAKELRRVPPFAALFALRGLLQWAPLFALATPLTLVDGPSTAVPWTLLSDGMIPTLCRSISAAADPSDRHPALQTLNICLERLLQQWGQGQGVALELKHQRLLLSGLWSVWDDPQPSIVRLAQSSFNHLISLVDLQIKAEAAQGELANGAAAALDDRVAAFLRSIADDLLVLDPEEKRRYAPLMALIPHLGAGALLALRPALVEETLGAMASNSAVCSPATGMLRALWLQRLEETGAGTPEAPAAAVAAWRASWAPQLKQALCGGDDHMRDVVCTYAVPAVVDSDPSAIQTVLLPAVAAAPEEVAAAAAVSLLSIGRRLKVIGDLDDAASSAPGLDVSALLNRAVVHRSATLRAGTLTLACSHPRTSALPTAQELSLVATALRVDMRTTLAAVRQQTAPPVARLLSRMRVGAGAVLARPHEFPTEACADLARCEAWLRRLGAGVLAAAHPGSQYSRKYMAVDLLCALLETYGDLMVAAPTSQGAAAMPALRKVPLRNAMVRKADGFSSAKGLRSGAFRPFFAGFCAPATTDLLLSCVSDSWDKIREGAARALGSMPAPLPGVETPAAVLRMLRWALGLLRSPRLKDADAGARVVLLVFQQYVQGLGWRCAVAPYPAAFAHLQPPADPEYAVLAASLDYLASCAGLVRRSVEAGEQDLGAAARESLSHGPLLALRYVLPAVPWTALLSHRDFEGPTRALAARLLTTLQRLNDVVLPILSTPEEMNMAAADVDESDGSGFAQQQLHQETETSQDAFTIPAGAAVDSLGPEAQVINCACWMSAKELALVLGTLCQAAPVVNNAAWPPPRQPLLLPGKLAASGGMLLRTLLELKHSGAVDKTQQGMEALAAAVLGADAGSGLPQLAPQWLDGLIAHMRRAGQSRSDITRRSAGLPFAIQAMLRARAHRASRPLAARGLAALLATAAAEDLEECWPRVHAFNALRVALADTEMGQETAPFQSQGLQVAIAALAAPEWEVRNAATLCYTTLLTRMMGFANLSTRELANRRVPTAFDFFEANPALHPFLLAQLRRAADDLEAGSNELHPCLSPILTLLLRLKPAARSSGGTGQARSAAKEAATYPAADDDGSPGVSNGGNVKGDLSASLLLKRAGNDGDAFGLSPASFIPLVQRCAAARPLAVRQQASKALAPLVPAERMAEISGELATDVAAALQSASGTSLWNANRVHGQLLQLHELVTAVAADSSSNAAHAAEVLVAITTPLGGRAIAACAPGVYPCAPICRAMLRLACAVAALAAEATVVASETFTFVQKGAHQAWFGVSSTVIKDAAAGGAISEAEPMLGVALKEAVALRLLWWPKYRTRCLQEAQATLRLDELDGSSSSPWAEDFCVALSSRRSEARCAALKCLLRLLEGGLTEGDNACALRALRAVLVAHLTTERHPKALKRTLHALSLILLTDSLSTAQGTGDEEEEEERLFAAVTQHAKHAKDPFICQHAIACMGQLAGSCSGGKGARSARTAALVAVAENFSRPEQVPDLRLVTAEMLGASGLLRAEDRKEERKEGSDDAEHYVAVWGVALGLLEDEDLDVRTAAAEAAAAALARLPGAPQRDACVETVFGSALGVLCSHLGASPPLLRMLRRRTCDIAAATAKAQAALTAAAAAAAAERESSQREGTNRIIIGRLFDREIDNSHEEPLQAAQLAATALSSLLSSVAAPHVSDDALRWGAEALRSLQLLTQAPGWAECSGYARAAEVEAAFLPIYSLVLAVWAAGRCRGAGGALVEEAAAAVRELEGGAFLDGIGSHPLLKEAWSAAAAAWSGREDEEACATTLWDPVAFLPNFMA